MKKNISVLVISLLVLILSGARVGGQPSLSLAVVAVPTGGFSGSAFISTYPNGERANVADEQFIKDVARRCEQIATSSRNEAGANDALICKELAVDITVLNAAIDKMTSLANAKNWKNYLLLDAVQREIAKDDIEIKVLEDSLTAFKSGVVGLERPIFAPVQQSLERLVSFYTESNNPQEYTEEDEKYFADICERFPGLIEKYLLSDHANEAETITVYLEELKYCRPNSAEVYELVKLVTEYFAGPNFILSSSSTILPVTALQTVDEPVTVAETIRGAIVRGQGTAKGSVFLKFIPNNDVAEFQMLVNTDIKTETVAHREGTKVYSSNSGTITAMKPLFFGEHFTTKPTNANGVVESRITYIDSGRGAIGQNVAQKRVFEEKPYSQAESIQKMEQKVAKRLDEQVDTQINKMNSNLREYFIAPLKNRKYYPRHIQTSTATNRLFWSALIGNELQLGLPRHKMRQIEPNSADLTILLHQSCPNNTIFVSLAGKKTNQDEIVRQIQSALPEHLAESLTPKKISNQSDIKENKMENGGATDEAPLWFVFSEEMPMTVTFSDNLINIAMRVVEFEKEGRTYPGLNIDILYEIVANNDFVLKRKRLDVFPADIERDQVIPARYQAIRSLVLKKMNEQMAEESLLPAFEVPATNAKGEAIPLKQGTFVPVTFTTAGGWLTLDYQLVPVSSKQQ